MSNESNATQVAVGTMYRQGDWLLIKVSDSVPTEAKAEARDSLNRLVIGEGEATGHAHAVCEKEAAIYELNGLRWLVAEEPVTVVHDEHAPIIVDIGTWVLRPQRVYDAASQQVRKVLD